MRKFVLPTSLVIASLLAACGGGGGDTEPKFSFAVIGDLPYGTSPTDTEQFLASPAFISSINADPNVELVLHVGDIHSGKQYCTEEYNRSIYAQWTAFKAPLVYTPGDNEWTDCHKSKEGGGTYNPKTDQIDYKLDANGKPINYEKGNPVANLALVRSIFFANPGKSLGSSITLHSQANEYDKAYPTDKNYVENVWFEKSKIMFVAVNIPGGSNNGTDPWYGVPTASKEQAQEITDRTAANLRWLDTSFKQAISTGSKALVLQIQADMWDLDGNDPSHISQYKQFIDNIATNTKRFGKPVLLLNGDSHIYRSDNPLVLGATCLTEGKYPTETTACSDDAYKNQPHGYNVPNFRRVVVHGSTMPLTWLKMTVNPDISAANGTKAFGPFSW